MISRASAAYAAEALLLCPFQAKKGKRKLRTGRVAWEKAIAFSGKKV
jgi:hypothetical protein